MELKKLKELVEGYSLIVVDEAQYVTEIGLTEK